MKRQVLLSVLILLSSVSLLAAKTIYVPTDFPHIQDAIDTAANYDTIVIENGIYQDARDINLDFKGKAITVRSENGPESSIIHAANNGRGFYFHNGEGNDSIVDGFTITGGIADYGGAIECENSSPTISNCIITNNSAEFDGGGIDCWNASPIIVNCIINSNIADRDGAGIECYQSSPTINNCLIMQGFAMGSGGGIDCYNYSAPIIRNCTIVDNADRGNAGGIHADSSSSPTITNCILWDNRGDLDGCTAEFSCIEDGDPGTGNISSVPLFRTGPLQGSIGSYYLSQTAAGQLRNSPCIDAGVGAALALVDANSFTTRTDSVKDEGVVDMGFHYPDSGPVINYYLITSVVGGNGSIEPEHPDPGALYKQFTDVGLTAIPVEGYKVKRWSGTNNDPSIKINQNIVTITGDENVTVEFEPFDTYQLTTMVDFNTPFGSIVPGSGLYQEDSVVKITAIPNDDYRVQYWWDNGAVSINPLDPNHHTTVMTSDKTVMVRFIPKYITYSLTIEIVDADGNPDSSMGTVEPRRGGIYPVGTIVDINATPINQDYEIKKWTGTDQVLIDPNNTDRRQTVTMDGDKSVTVEFGLRNKYNLTVSIVGGHGTVTPLGGPVEYYEGDEVTITAIPDEAYELREWIIDGGLVSPDPLNYNKLNLLMDSDKNVQARFWKAVSINNDPVLRFSTIQSAIDKANEWDVVIVGDGIWTGDGNVDLEFKEKPITVKSKNGPQNCIIDCNGTDEEAHRGFNFTNITDVNLVYVVNGFTIKNGYEQQGGAVNVNDVNATLTIQNCILEDNTAVESGGGIYCVETQATILSTEFLSNTSYGTGGGMGCDANSDANFINCLFAYNQSTDMGGAIYITGSDPNIHLCTVVYNNSDFWDDGAQAYLGGICAEESEPTISNCIIGRNYEYTQYNEWGYEYYYGDDLFGCEATYSCIENGDTGEGNIEDDPMFITGSFGDFYLNEFYRYIYNPDGSYEYIPESPCIDSGQNDFYIDLQQAPPDGFSLDNDLTTSVLSTPDDRYTDMGYHYPPWKGSEPFKYEITVSVPVNGIVRYFEVDDYNGVIIQQGEVAPGTSPVTLEVFPNSRIRLTAVPDPNYRVYRWYRNGSYYSNYKNVEFNAYSSENFFVLFELVQTKTIHVPGSFPYMGVQDAIDQARSGDTIVVHPGTYPGTGFVVDKAINITCLDPCNPDIIANTIIDCNISEVETGHGSFGFALVDIGEGPAVLNGFTIVNARIRTVNGTDGSLPGVMGSPSNSLFGGAIRVAGDHIIVNCFIRYCWVMSGDGGNGAGGGVRYGMPYFDGGQGGDSGNVGGGGIYISSGSPLIKNCLIEDCNANSGNGGNGGPGGAATAPDADPSHPGGEGGNGGLAGYARGGGIYCAGGSPTFENVILRNCQAVVGRGGNGGNGGASGDSMAWGRTTGNRGGDAGVPLPASAGGVCSASNSSPKFVNCTIEDNLAQGGRGGNGGNSGGDAWNYWRGGLGGLCETKYLQEVIDEGDSPPQSYAYYYGYYSQNYMAPQNFSTFGGGIHCGDESSSILNDCAINNNITIGAISGLGGLNSYGVSNFPNKYFEMPSYGSGIYVGKYPSIVLLECTLEGNHADYAGSADPNTDPNYEHLGYGGGVCIDAGQLNWGSARFKNCQITNNTTPIGGGMYATGLTNFDISDSNFIDNLAYSGAGLFVAANINANISRCNFFNNRADNSVYPENPDPNLIEASIPGAGGGLFLFTTDVLVSDCKIINNAATGLGGGVYMGGKIENPYFETKPRLKNCLITNNTTYYNGGGICCDWEAEPTITNCTIAENTAGPSGGGIYCSYESITDLTNSIIWNNTSADDTQIALNDNNPYNPAPTSLNISYSDIEDGQAGIFVGTDSILNWGNDIIEDDPLFVAGDRGSYYLCQINGGQTIDSPCVDAGKYWANSLGLHKYTTSTSNIPDRGLADMGYHYPTFLTIPGDLDLDGDIDLEDLKILLLYWLEENCQLFEDCEGADFDLDGDVDFTDYATFALYHYRENFADITAPTPNPMTWALLPSIVDYSTVIMTATTASDESGVQYYFDCVEGDCHDSGWQEGVTYTDTELADDAEYTYRVKARDKSSFRNETKWSVEKMVIIPSKDEDIFPPEPNPSTWEVEPFEESPFVISMTATTATDISLPVMYYFRCTSDNGHDSGWQTSATYEDNVFVDETIYCYTVKTKDAYDFNTIDSVESCVRIDNRAPQPDPSTWQTKPTTESISSVTMTATTANDPCGVEYYFECTSGSGHNSNWQDSPTYTDTGLTEEVTYTYRVKTRDKSHNRNEGLWSTEESATTYTDLAAPQPNPSEWAQGGEPNAVPGQYKISMTAKTATDDSGVEYFFECTAGGGHSSIEWQDGPTYIDTGLSADVIYTYKVKARDKSSAQNETGWSVEKSAMIDFTPPTPDPSQWLVEPEDYYDDVNNTYRHRMVAVKATDSNAFDPIAGVTDPNRVEYYFQCLNAADSGWQDSAVYEPAVSGPGLRYAYKVKTRDKSTNNNETAYTEWALAKP